MPAVHTRTRNWSAFIRSVDPDREREKRKEKEYTFGHGSKRREFFGDPSKRGAYADE